MVDAQWVQRGLGRSKEANFQVQWVEKLYLAEDLLKSQLFHIAICDLQLPDGFGLEIYDRLRSVASQIPFILLTGTIEEQAIAQEALHRGAQDYILKGQATHEALIRSMIYAIERQALTNMKNKFVSIVSHELRTPLSAISSSIDMISNEVLGPITLEQKEFLKLIMVSIDRMGRISTELLALAKLEEGKTALNKQRFDMIALAKEILFQFKPLADKKGLQLKLDVKPDSDVVAVADRDKIARVLVNLINNAMKFTEKGSIELTLKDSGDATECSIRDTGTGIAQENLPKVFSKFEQFGKQKQSEQGSGLGLSICKEIILLHHGKIWVECELGKGSRFIFTLPKIKIQEIQISS